MKVNTIKIQNFRSFGDQETVVQVQEGLTGVIGYNSAGKSSLLEAFRKVFGPASYERSIQRSDFHIPKGKNPEEIGESSLSIEIVFGFEEGDIAASEFFESLIVNKPDGSPYLRVRLEAYWERDSNLPEGNIEVKLYYIRCPEGEEEDESVKSPLPNRHRSLIQSFYVPAIRKPSEQIKYASGSVLYRLLRRITWAEDFETNFKEKLDGINELFREEKQFNNIESTVAGIWKEYHKDERYSQSTITFGSTEFESILKKLEVEFSPSDTERPYKIDDLGEGYRSLFYLTLVTALLKIENELPDDQSGKPFLTVLLIEEPENHIAPHLLGRVIRNLKELAKGSNVQVVLSSHTPAIVGRIDPEAIRHLRLDKEKHHTVASQILLPSKEVEAHKFIKEAVRNYPEIYFARLVIIGEGDSEDIILKRLAQVYNQDLDDHLISFAPLGHRFVNHIWSLLDQLGVPYVTLLDLDRERNGGGWGRIKYILKQLLESGVERKELLTMQGGAVMTDDSLNKMHTWDDKNNTLMDKWIKYLEKYSVYYCSPLDLDFLMLEVFTAEYKSIVPKGRGPQIPDKTKKPTEYQVKLDKSVQATLKSEKATGKTFTLGQREMMIWYNYHFLGRGKPSTHIMAMSKLADADLKARTPEVLARLFAEVESIISTKP